MVYHKRPASFFITIHDLSPAVIPQVRDVLFFLRNNGKQAAVLLVIPGLFQSEEDLLSLKKLLADFPFVTLAGHGWKHRAVANKNLYHRLHSLFISRQVAEHLSLPEGELSRLIEKSFSWFVENGFPAPELYVPPAWAMGKISRTSLQKLPFRYYEYQHGIYDSVRDEFVFLPLVGFEADTSWRRVALDLWNKINFYWASGRRKCLRVAIHPFDLQLKLADDLLYFISRKCPATVEPAELFFRGGV